MRGMAGEFSEYNTIMSMASFLLTYCLTVKRCRRGGREVEEQMGR